MTVTIPGATLTHAAAQRPALERFIAERFRQAYGAQVSHFCAHLLGLRDAAGKWQAAAGYTPAASGALYLEHYLDRPVEDAREPASYREPDHLCLLSCGRSEHQHQRGHSRYAAGAPRSAVPLGFVTQSQAMPPGTGNQ